MIDRISPEMDESVKANSDTSEVDSALTAIINAEGTIIVDFDHTLFSSNSTELFLASARPAFLVSLLLGIARGVFPWYLYSTRWFRLRDYVIVVAVIALMPWSLLAWRRRGPALLRQQTTHPIARGLAGVPPDRIVIVSFGMAALIRPLLRGSAWESCRLISMKIPCKWGDLLTGKAALVRREAPDISLAKAVFITDSENDKDLLAVVASPHLIPRQGAAVLADSRLYLPWRYAGLGKFSREYLVDQAVFVNLVLVFLTTRIFWTWSPWVVAGALFLYVSLNAIYEIGYFENDFKAVSREVEPKLKQGSEMFLGFALERQAWVWGSGAAVLGCLAVAKGEKVQGLALLGILASWSAVLFTIRVIFYIYNRQSETTRMFIYPFLQAVKYFGLLVIFPSFGLGIALLSAQMMMMWIKYIVYRLGGRYHDLPHEEVRLAALLALGLGFMLYNPNVLIEAPPAALAAVLGWAIWRVVQHPLRRKFRGGRR